MNDTTLSWIWTWCLHLILNWRTLISGQSSVDQQDPMFSIADPCVLNSDLEELEEICLADSKPRQEPSQFKIINHFHLNKVAQWVSNCFLGFGTHLTGTINWSTMAYVVLWQETISLHTRFSATTFQSYSFSGLPSFWQAQRVLRTIEIILNLIFSLIPIPFSSRIAFSE